MSVPQTAKTPQCISCGQKPPKYKWWVRCEECQRKFLTESPAVTFPSAVVLAEIRDKKRLEMIEKGELCTRCGRGSTEPGHEYCYGCERETAKRAVPKALGRMPETCMYGWLGKFARMLDSPLDAAYPVVLGIAAGYGVPSYKSLRSNLYVNIIGEKGSGKTRVIDRALDSWQPPTQSQIVKKYPGSEIGLIQLLGGKKAKEMEECDHIPRPYLLVQDEMRISFNKMGIQGSSLPNMLNDLFYHDSFGTAAKQGHWECCAQLSVVGGLTCNGPDEFADIYGVATTQGTYDRTLFGLMPSWEFDDLWEPTIDDAVSFRRPKGVIIPREIYEAVKKWRRSDPENRRRLGELALRVALVTASLNHDDEITPACLRCALEFTEWQESVRKRYSPSETDDLDGKAEGAVIRALEQHEDWMDWRSLCTKHNLYRKCGGSVRLNRVKRAMVSEGVIEEEYELKEDGTHGGKTKCVRLGR